MDWNSFFPETNYEKRPRPIAWRGEKARTAIGTTMLTAIADRGYLKGEEILACHDVGISILEGRQWSIRRFDNA
jgi:hypothetical protein